MKPTAIALSLLAAAMMAACDGRVYDTYRHTPLSGWEKNDTLYYDTPAVREGGIYDMTLGIRTNNSFPFTAVTLIVDVTTLPSRATWADTLDCRLVKAGSSHRQGGISYYEYTTQVRQAHLAQGDSLHITVRHDMKRDILPGVSDVGIALSKR